MARDEARGSFLDSLGRLFRTREEAPAAPPPAAEEAGFAKLEADFDAAVRALNDRILEQRGTAAVTAAGSATARQTAEERAAERAKRMESAHQAMRQDIEAMHARLGTGLAGGDLDALAALLGELEAMATAGKGSLDLLPRARHAILERLRAEAGELAIARVAGRLRAQQMEWPDPYRPPASATPEEVERARQRRLADVRRAFLADGFARTAESLTGVVKGWGADYPDRGSPLWEANVLEGVVSGVRAALLRDFVDTLRNDREALLRETESAVGKELAAVQAALAGGVRSLDQASRAVEGAMKVLDEVLPDFAWQRVRTQLPAARGEA